MSERVPIEILERHREYYNKQEGRKYPCSNQIVRCGVFTSDRDKAIEFMENKDVADKRERKDSITWFLDNGEQWVWTNWNENHRGYRFYKVAIDRDIDRNIYECIVMPYTGLYCCSFEII